MRNLDFDNPEVIKHMQKRYRRGKIMGGLLLVGAGILFMARELGADLPHWLFTWKSLLIALGLVAGAKRLFYPGGWLIPVLVGVGFLVSDLYPELMIRPFLWPVVLIIAGIVMMFRPFRPFRHHRHYRRHCRQWQNHDLEKKNSSGYDSVGNASYETSGNEDYLESTTVFGGVKKVIFSKSFKGGEVTNVFGGTEINLMQADFEGTVKLEVTQVFGGTRLFIPAHWEIRSASMTAVLGSIEDKRSSVPVVGQGNKVLVLEGTSVVGGIEIRSI
jgi:hypothetical protein